MHRMDRARLLYGDADTRRAGSPAQGAAAATRGWCWTPLAAYWDDAWPGGLLLALGTDGVDGSSDAAGALVDGHAFAAARRLRLDPHGALAENDAHAFFGALGTSLRTGPTDTNVVDLLLWLP